MLARLREGDEAAFVTLVGRYQQPMLRLARSFAPSQAVAEEAVQDTWLGLVRGIERFEGRSSFKTWLFAILVNRARSAGAREPATAPMESLHTVDPARFDNQGQWADPVSGWTDQSEDRLDAAAWAPILRSALDDLPPASAGSSCCAMSKGSPTTRRAPCWASPQATSGCSCTVGAPSCAPSSMQSWGDDDRALLTP